jgi:hypothetical protein
MDYRHEDEKIASESWGHLGVNVDHLFLKILVFIVLHSNNDLGDHFEVTA